MGMHLYWNWQEKDGECLTIFYPKLWFSYLKAWFSYPQVWFSYPKAWDKFFLGILGLFFGSSQLI